MKVVFIVGSFEQRKDGVGDYARRLSGRLIELEHEAYVLALNDQFAIQETWETQYENGVEIESLRLPVNTPLERKIKLSKSWIQDIKPQWISLQYVPFAYQHKGLPFRLSHQLKQIGEGCKWHIMFHELWTGMKIGTSVKEYILGRMQQVLIFSMIKSLKPAVIHTQSQIYQAQLAKRHIKAIHLPLFGNIPLLPVTKELRQDNKVRLVLFGGIHPGACIEELVKKLQHFMEQTGKQVEIVFIGRNGAELKIWESVLQKSNIMVTILGEQPVESISAWFQQVDAGIFTTPAMLAEKSGSVAAMLEHNLRVICVQTPWIGRGLENFEPNLTVYDLDKIDFQQFFREKPSKSTSINLATVTGQFIHNLKL